MSMYVCIFSCRTYARHYIALLIDNAIISIKANEYGIYETQTYLYIFLFNFCIIYSRGSQSGFRGTLGFRDALPGVPHTFIKN